MTSGFSWNLNRFEPVLGGLSRLKEMTLYTSMPMVCSNENNIMYSNNIVIIWKRRISFFVSNYLRILIEDLRTLANLKRQMKKPKSTVKRMVDYFKQNPIPLVQFHKQI